MAEETGSIIEFAVARAVREDPELALATRRRLVHRVAALEVEYLALTARLGLKAVEWLGQTKPQDLEMPLVGLFRRNAELETLILNLLERLAARETRSRP